jgi:hypothetical protein
MTKKQHETSGQQKGAGKIKSLKLKKQTVRDLSAEELSKVKGGCIHHGVMFSNPN